MNKSPSHYFRKLSLTQQVFILILLFLIFFLAFFFLFLSQNIDNTISKQMYDLLSKRQQSIVAMINQNTQAEKTPVLDEELLDFIASDSIQVNCLIRGDNVVLMGPDEDKNMHEDVYVYLTQEASKLVVSDMVSTQGIYITKEGKFYYRLERTRASSNSVVVASFMDQTYPQSLRDSVIDSTVYVTVLAFSAVLMIMTVWVFSIIHPLNQIKSYVEQIKQGKEVELHMNRDDEIGEVANAIVTLKDELTKQEKVKEEMIHNISHDLKTPIATIKSYSESIKDGIYPYGSLESSVDVILDNAQRLEDKVHNLLYLNRIEYLVTSDAEGVVTNMKEVVEQVVLNSAVIRPEIEIITDVEEVFFDGLIEAWRVAIENIMENAFRYAKSYIKITVREHDLCISNDGPKMPEDRIETLFRPYEKGEGGRFGLGLSIVSKVCKANHYIVKGFNTDDGVCFRIYRKKPKVKKKNSEGRKKDNKKDHADKKKN